MFKSYDDIFNTRGESYHHAMQMVPHARREEFELGLGELGLENGDVLLDLPSGGGYLAEYVPADLDVGIIAIDPSEVFSRQWQNERLQTYLAPMCDLPVPDGSVDALVSIAGLHHADKLVEIFREMRRVIQPGGTLCILEVAEGSKVDAFLNGFVNEHCSMGHEGAFINDQFRKDLVAEGFRIKHDELHDYSWNFSDAGEMTAYVQCMFGLDKADAGTTLEAIDRILGYQADGSGCRMHWQLQRILAE